MKKGLKIAGIALAIVAGFLAIIAVWQWDSIRFVLDNYDTLQEGSDYVADLENPEDLLNFMETRKDDVALHIIHMNDTDHEISWRSSQQQPAASTYKILVLAEISRQVEEGELDPDQMVPVDEIRHHYLPRTDGEAHQEAFRNFEEEGIISQNRIALRDVVRAMIRWSDNAATDYLIHLAGRENLEELVEYIDPESLETPFPINGSYLLWEHHEHDTPAGERLETYRSWSREKLTDEAYELSTRMAEDETFRETEQTRLEESRLGLGLEMQREFAHAITPAGSPEAYAGIMQAVFLGDFISPEVATRMQEFLEWPMTNERIQQEFAQFGSKGGSLPAVFTSANYGRAHEDDPVVVTLFFQNLPFAVWFHLMQQQIHQEFELRVMKDPEFRETVEERVEQW